MRNVVSNDEVYHLWAHQTQAKATGYGACSFQGRDAYSYSTIIGRIVENGQGGKLYLLATRNRSVTTSKHQGMVRSAVPSVAAIVLVPSISEDTHEMLNEMLKDAVEMRDRAHRARSQKPYLLRHYQRQLDGIRTFCRFYGLPGPEGLETNLDLAIARVDEENKERMRAAEEAAQKRREREQAVAMKDLPAWLEGRGHGTLLHRLPYAYLRVAGDEVQTSMGARVPLCDVQQAAPYVLALIEQARDSGEAQKPEHGIRLGYYRVDRVEATGTVVAGCHRFEASEVERFAQVVSAKVNGSRLPQPVRTETGEGAA